jgi:hypothetical protein
MEALLVILGVFVLIPILFLYGSFSWGFVFFKFWSWFVLPVFSFLPSINFWQAVGLWVFISLFHNQQVQQVKDEYLKDSTERTVSGIVLPWVVLLIGWVIKLVIS